jgi:hypothetical protein
VKRRFDQVCGQVWTAHQKFQGELVIFLFDYLFCSESPNRGSPASPDGFILCRKSRASAHAN